MHPGVGSRLMYRPLLAVGGLSFALSKRLESVRMTPEQAGKRMEQNRAGGGARRLRIGVTTCEFRSVTQGWGGLGPRPGDGRSDKCSQIFSDPSSGTRCARLRPRLLSAPGKYQREHQCRWYFPGPLAGVEGARPGHVPQVGRVSRAAQGCRRASSCGLLLRPKWLRCPCW